MVIKPPPLRQVIPEGFTIDEFTNDDQAGTATCPAGRTAALGRPTPATFCLLLTGSQGWDHEAIADVGVELVS
jgi:hypothetical protein